jgi:hypothetical protein
MLPNAETIYPGIIVYRDVFKKEYNLDTRLESVLSKTQGKKHWNLAQTGYDTLNKDYRDAWDFKIKENEGGSLMLGNGTHVEPEDFTEEEFELRSIWRESKAAQLSAVYDYMNMFQIPPLNYWEAFNFIKYGKNQHFNVHSDHGYSYVCVLSSVGYINDDYEGGELFFDKLGVKVKPRAGDLYLFPSSFIYSHAAMPVTSGTKYAIVTMLDYQEAPHTPLYREIEASYEYNHITEGKKFKPAEQLMEEKKVD